MFVRSRVFVDKIMAGEAGNTGSAAEPRSDGSIRKTDANSRPCAGGTAGKRPAMRWERSGANQDPATTAVSVQAAGRLLAGCSAQPALPSLSPVLPA